MNKSLIGFGAFVALICGVMIIYIAVATSDADLMSLAAALVAAFGLLFRRAAEEANLFKEETRRRIESYTFIISLAMIIAWYILEKWHHANP
jgi:hypothetical protein